MENDPTLRLCSDTTNQISVKILRVCTLSVATYGYTIKAQLSVIEEKTIAHLTATGGKIRTFGLECNRTILRIPWTRKVAILRDLNIEGNSFMENVVI